MDGQGNADGPLQPEVQKEKHIDNWRWPHPHDKKYDNEDYRYDGHGEENDDISLDDILDKDEGMNKHTQDLAFLDWFGEEFWPKKHKKQKKPISPLVLNLMNQVKEKGHCKYHELKNQHMRKPGTEHWLVYANVCKAVPPTTTRGFLKQIQNN